MQRPWQLIGLGRGAGSGSGQAEGRIVLMPGEGRGEEKLLTAVHGRGDLQEDSLQGLALYALGVARLGPYRSCHLLIDRER